MSRSNEGSTNRPFRTIRELGGEIWSELNKRIDAKPDDKFDWQTVSEVTDLIMGVLARYSDHTLINDPDLPVEPLRSSGFGAEVLDSEK